MVLAVASISARQVHKITCPADKPVADIQPTKRSVFFEDINFVADGGIYAEPVKNRSNEFSLPLMRWTQVRQKGKNMVLPDFNSSANPEMIIPVSGPFTLSGIGLNIPYEAGSFNAIFLEYKN